MTGRIFPLNASEHAAVDALLPWYVNKTLRGEELERVEQHVAACPACRREVDWLKDVFAACAALAPLPQVELPPGDGGLAPGDSKPPRRPARARADWQSTPTWMRMLMAAQLAAVVVMGTLLAFGDGTEPSYRTLGAATPPMSRGEAIAVMFDPAMTEAELRRVVTEVGARIVDGPTTTHAFVLEVPVAQANAAIEKLRAEPRVRMAAAMGSRTAP